MDNTNFDRERDFVLRGMDNRFRGAFLAGGAITSTFTNKPIADYDIYFKTGEAFEEAIRNAYDDGLWCVSSSGRALTFADGNLVLQLMHFAFFENAEAIFDSFDFTCCMAAIDLDTKTFAFHPTFLSDTSKRELVFNHKTAYPLASAMRVLKYQEKGYTIRKTEMLKIITTCSFKAIEGWDELRDQIGGRYGQAVAMDATGDFNLDNAINGLDRMQQIPASLAVAPGSANEALEAIFGQPHVDDNTA